MSGLPLPCSALHWSQVSFNEQEVMAVEWVGLAELAERMQQQPDSFTPWFLDEAALLLASTSAAEHN